MPLFAAGRTKVGARFIVHSASGGRGEATPLPSAALRRPSLVTLASLSFPSANRQPLIPIIGRAAIAIAAIRHGTRVVTGRLFDRSHLRPPTDVMAITSLPKTAKQNSKGNRRPDDWLGCPFSGPGSQLSGIWFRCSGSGAGTGPEPGCLPRVGRPLPWPPFATARAFHRA